MIYYENNVEGLFSTTARGVLPVGFKGSSTGKPPPIVAGNFDDKGNADVVLALDNYHVDSVAIIVFSGSGDGTFSLTEVCPVAYDGPSNGTPALVSSDFDGDRDNDIVMTLNSTYADSATMVCFSNEGGTYTATAVYPVGFQGGATGKPASVIADVDADNDMDIVTHFGTDSIWVFANDGTGQFEVKRGIYPVGFKGSSTGKPASLVAADFDGNGSIEIGVAMADVDSVAIMFGQRDCACVDPPDSMVAWFPFDETVGPDANNAAAGNDGTHENGPTIEPGQVQNSLCFDGLSSYVNVPSYPAIEIGTSDLTIDAWIKRSANDDNSTRVITDKRTDGAGDNVGYSFYLYQGKLGLQLSTPSQSFQNWVSNAVVSKDVWHHVAVSVDRDEPDGVSFYLDGSLILPQYNATGWDGDLSNEFPLRIGARSYEASGLFYGCIDEVEVFNRVLTPQEISDIWWAGECGKCKFICGDANADGTVNITDAVYLITYIFAGGPPPDPYEAGDANCDGTVNITDAVYLITYIFGGGPAPCEECP